MLVLNAHCLVIIYKFSQKKKDITIILYSATIYVHKIPNPFSLTRENVGRSRSSVTIVFVRCPLLITGCHGAPLSTSSIHRSGLICAARGTTSSHTDNNTATTSAIPIFNYDPQFNSAPATHYPISKPKPSSRKPTSCAQAILDTKRAS